MFTGISRLKSLSVGDVMSRDVVELFQDQTMEEAVQVFASQHVSSAPVLDDRGRCVGILSSSDFLKQKPDGSRGSGASNHQLNQANSEAPFDLESPGNFVALYMTTAVQTVAPTEPLLQVARIMCAEHIHHLPVVEGDRAVGIVSTMDVVAALLNTLDEMHAKR